MGMKLKKQGVQITIAVFLTLGAMFSLSPIILALINSFKTKGEMFSNILMLAKEPVIDNYVRTLEKINYLSSFINTLIIVGVGLGGILFFSAMAGWTLCRTKTKLSSFIFGLFVFSMLIPFNAIMIPLYKVALTLHLTNSRVGMGLIYIGLGVSMAIFMYHGFVKSIPFEIEESAYIDGCSHFQVFFKVVLPLLTPVTATVAIMNILWIWNDFLLPLIMLQTKENYTLLLSTNMLFGQYSSDWPAVLSALILTVLPVIILYAFLQKNILKGVVEGAIKG